MLNFKTGSSIFESMRAYLQTLTTALTDFNIGSVLCSVFDTCANAIGNLYVSLQNVYDSMFVSTATGTDLDNRVADFTLLRKQATTSSGLLTFSRSTPGLTNYTIPQGTLAQTPSTQTTAGVQFQTTTSAILSVLLSDEAHVYETGTLSYDLDSRLASGIVSITGTYLSSGGYAFTNTAQPSGTDYYLDITTNPYQHKVHWTGVHVPDDSSTFYVTYNPLSVDINAQCIYTASVGNAGAQSIIVMPSPPAGIENVINYNAFTGGTDAESDDALRARVPAYLASLARATKNALIGAALSVNGVVSASIVEPNPPTGYCSLYIDDGSGTASSTLVNAVRQVIDGLLSGTEAFRGCSLGVNVVAPILRSVNISVTIALETNANFTTVKNAIQNAITSYMDTLGLTEKLYVSRIIELAQDVSGVDYVVIASVIPNTTISPATNEVLRAGNLVISQ